MIKLRFAGIALKWTYEFAKDYADKLFEMGYEAKVIDVNEEHIVAYGYQAFGKADAIIAFEHLVRQKTEE